MLLFVSCRAHICVVHKHKFIMTDFETEYVFCRDNRLVLIVECLFAKASTAKSLSS